MRFFLLLLVASGGLFWVLEEEPQGSAAEHARAVSRCFSTYANGGQPINDCYEELSVANRRAWARSNPAVREVVQEVERELAKVEMAYGFSMDTQRLKEAPGGRMRDSIKKLAKKMSEVYWNASRAVR